MKATRRRVAGARVAVVVGRLSWGRHVLRGKNRDTFTIVMCVDDTRGIKWSAFMVPDGPPLEREQHAAIEALRYRGVPGITDWSALERLTETA